MLDQRPSNQDHRVIKPNPSTHFNKQITVRMTQHITIHSLFSPVPRMFSHKTGPIEQQYLNVSNSLHLAGKNLFTEFQMQKLIRHASTDN